MLSVYTLEKKEEWDTIVRSFVDYDIYYLSGYVKAFQLHGDGEPLLFYYKDASIRGINVVMKRDIAKFEAFAGKLKEENYFDFSTPYGYGGWLVEGENLEPLFKQYETWCRKNKIVSEFVRFHPVIKNYVTFEKEYDIVALGNTVTMDLSLPEKIWANMVSRGRNTVRKAWKNGVRIYNGRYPEIYEKFRVLYNKTMDKDNAKEYYYFSKEFYTSILEDLPQNAQVFYAQIPDNTIIAGAIMLTANKKINYHLSGNLSEYSSLAAMNLLLYEAAQWGCANGYKTLYLGGGVGAKEDNLFQFKRAFYKGELNLFYIGKKVFLEDIYSELVRIRGNVETEDYFPAYRKI